MGKSTKIFRNIPLVAVKDIFPKWEQSKFILENNHPMFHIHPVGDTYLEYGHGLDDKIRVRVVVTLGGEKLQELIIEDATLRKVDNEVRTHYPLSYVHFGPSHIDREREHYLNGGFLDDGIDYD